MSDYDRYSAVGQQYAAQYGVPWPIFAGLIQQESGWNAVPAGYNDGGLAYGFGQLHEGAAADVGVNRYDPNQNLKGSAAYLAQQYKATGNWTDAIAAYNQGIGKYSNSAGQSYAQSVLNNAKTLFGWDGSTTVSTPATGTSGQTGSEYTAQAAQTNSTLSSLSNPATNPVSGSGSLWDSVSGMLGNFMSGLGGSNTPATGAGAPAPNDGTTSGTYITGAAGAASSALGLSGVNDFFTKISSAEFWQKSFLYIIVAVAAVALVLFGVFATTRATVPSVSKVLS